MASHQFRGDGPVQWSEAYQAWLLTRHADVVAVLRDPRFSAAACLRAALDSLPPAARGELVAVTSIVSNTLAYLDPPQHTHMRRLVNVIYQPSVAEALRPRIQRIVNELLDSAHQAGSIDVARDLAYPLPARIIVELFALPTADWSMLARSADEFTALSGPAFDSISACRLAEGAMGDLSNYFHCAIAERRASPGPDLLSALVTGGGQGQRLDEDELIAACIMTLVGGHRSIRHAITAGMAMLRRCPELLEKIRKDLSLLPAFVEESLRYQGGVAPHLSRVAGEDVSIGDKTIRRGQAVLLVGNAANRDPAQFYDPDTFNPGRRPNHHLTFGAGIHRCPGAPLARVAVSISLASMLRRLPA